MMTSISTEDKFLVGCVEMGRGFGLYLFTALLILVIVCSILISQFYISDSDASTYVIMPLLMLPLFALFMLKEKDALRPDVHRRDIALGAMTGRTIPNITSSTVHTMP